MRWQRVSAEECAPGSTMHGWEERVRGRGVHRGLGDVLVVSSCQVRKDREAGPAQRCNMRDGMR